MHRHTFPALPRRSRSAWDALRQDAGSGFAFPTPVQTGSGSRRLSQPADVDRHPRRNAARPAEAGHVAAPPYATPPERTSRVAATAAQDARAVLSPASGPWATVRAATGSPARAVRRNAFPRGRGNRPAPAGARPWRPSWGPPSLPGARGRAPRAPVKRQPDASAPGSPDIRARGCDGRGCRCTARLRRGRAHARRPGAGEAVQAAGALRRWRLPAGCRWLPGRACRPAAAGSAARGARGG